MSSLEDYLQTITPEQRAYYERLRELVLAAAPQAEELMSYGVPTFKHNKRPLIYFGAYPNHSSVYPASDEMIEAIPALAPFRSGRGTLKFTAAKPLSEELLKEVLNFQLASITKPKS